MFNQFILGSKIGILVVSWPTLPAFFVQCNFLKIEF